jgi:hypothetical protein
MTDISVSKVNVCSQNKHSLILVPPYRFWGPSMQWLGEAHSLGVKCFAEVESSWSFTSTLLSLYAAWTFYVIFTKILMHIWESHWYTTHALLGYFYCIAAVLNFGCSDLYATISFAQSDSCFSIYKWITKEQSSVEK